MNDSSPSKESLAMQAAANWTPFGQNHDPAFIRSMRDAYASGYASATGALNQLKQDLAREANDRVILLQQIEDAKLQAKINGETVRNQAAHIAQLERQCTLLAQENDKFRDYVARGDAAEPAATLSENDVLQFIGWMTGDIQELHGVEVPRLMQSWQTFLRTRAIIERIAPTKPGPTLVDFSVHIAAQPAAGVVIDDADLVDAHEKADAPYVMKPSEEASFFKTLRKRAVPDETLSGSKPELPAEIEEICGYCDQSGHAGMECPKREADMAQRDKDEYRSRHGVAPAETNGDRS